MCSNLTVSLTESLEEGKKFPWKFYPRVLCWVQTLASAGQCLYRAAPGPRALVPSFASLPHVLH